LITKRCEWYENYRLRLGLLPSSRTSSHRSGSRYLRAPLIALLLDAEPDLASRVASTLKACITTRITCTLAGA
ncbi:MAG: hypothetical protein KGZ25_11010, partial [Planctomycetes bacterium]|nr:hypothetical protein [Planctomycetota bacterium]